jgi:Zn-dependent metalloprotease/subtilisin-like proprotein convertase family protein
MTRLTQKQAKASQRLCDFDAKNKIFWSDDGKIAKFIKGKLSAPSQNSAEAVARTFLDDNADLFSIDDQAAQRLETASVEQDKQGHSHVCLAQYVGDIPVHEGSIQIHINGQGVVTAYKDNRLAGVDINLQPAISEKAAVQTVMDDIALKCGQQKSALCIYRYFDSSHLLASDIKIKVPPTSIHLAWDIEIEVIEESGPRCYFIDAHDGTILYRFSETRCAMEWQTYTANNENRLPGILIVKGDETSEDDVVQAAHNNAKEVHRYYKTTFGRDSYDNRGAPIVSTVHFKQNYNNAYWSSFHGQMVYGDGDGVNFSPLAYALDIVGHEFTHAITSQTARFVYAEQSGALDEFFADFFGVMISNDGNINDWLMGEGVYTPLRSGDALRDLSTPSRFGLPDHMDNFKQLRPGELPDPDKNDLGWLHSNCGIPSKAAYLNIMGGTHHGIRVQGIGREKAEQIYYLGLTEYLRSAGRSRWTFMQARFALLNACRQLHGDDGEEYSSVKNAWAAVGIGEPAKQFAIIEKETNPGLAIPDNDTAGIASSLHVEEQGILKDFYVLVMISHPYINDLTVKLISPGGEEAILHERSGGSKDDIIAEYTPENTPALLTFMGDPVQGEWKLVVSDHARDDEGTLDYWGFTMAAEKIEQKSATRQVSADLPIPDNDPTGVTSLITLEEDGSILHNDVTVDISHSYIGDLQVILTGPSGEEAVLHANTGKNRHDIKKTFTSRKDDILRPFIGTATKGEWTLKVTDSAELDEGILNGWGLTVLYNETQ